MTLYCTSVKFINKKEKIWRFCQMFLMKKWPKLILFFCQWMWVVLGHVCYRKMTKNASPARCLVPIKDQKLCFGQIYVAKNEQNCSFCQMLVMKKWPKMNLLFCQSVGIDDCGFCQRGRLHEGSPKLVLEKIKILIFSFLLKNFFFHRLPFPGNVPASTKVFSAILKKLKLIETRSDQAGNPYWRGWIGTVYLLVLTTSDWLLFKLKQYFSFL